MAFLLFFYGVEHFTETPLNVGKLSISAEVFLAYALLHVPLMNSWLRHCFFSADAHIFCLHRKNTFAPIVANSRTESGTGNLLLIHKIAIVLFLYEGAPSQFLFSLVEVAVGDSPRPRLSHHVKRVQIASHTSITKEKT